MMERHLKSLLDNAVWRTRNMASFHRGILRLGSTAMPNVTTPSLSVSTLVEQGSL